MSFRFFMGITLQWNAEMVILPHARHSRHSPCHQDVPIPGDQPYVHVSDPRRMKRCLRGSCKKGGNIRATMITCPDCGGGPCDYIVRYGPIKDIISPYVDGVVLHHGQIAHVRDGKRISSMYHTGNFAGGGWAVMVDNGAYPEWWKNKHKPGWVPKDAATTLKQMVKVCNTITDLKWAKKRHEQGRPYAIDHPEFLVIPDVVTNWPETMRRCHQIMAMRDQWPKQKGWEWALALQDGFTINDVEDLLGTYPEIKRLFIGGTKEFKRPTCDLLLQSGLGSMYVHVGGINKVEELRWCWDHPVVDSIDTSMFSSSYPAPTERNVQGARPLMGAEWMYELGKPVGPVKDAVGLSPIQALSLLAAGKAALVEPPSHDAKDTSNKREIVTIYFDSEDNLWRAFITHPDGFVEGLASGTLQEVEIQANVYCHTHGATLEYDDSFPGVWSSSKR